MNQNYLESTRKQFEYYKSLGEKAIAQLSEADIHWQSDEESNSIAIIVNHLHGNMLSRWTNFLTEDGEKDWRNREQEFADLISDKADLTQKWEAGWSCLFEALDSLQPADLGRIIYIRNQGHTILEAITRQLCHYPYHVGQIVFLARQIRGTAWQSLSIPRGQSAQFNQKHFDQPKARGHFTHDLK